MEKFENPRFEAISFEREDVITTSIGMGGITVNPWEEICVNEACPSEGGCFEAV